MYRVRFSVETDMQAGADHGYEVCTPAVLCDYEPTQDQQSFDGYFSFFRTIIWRHNDHILLKQQFYYNYKIDLLNSINKVQFKASIYVISRQDCFQTPTRCIKHDLHGLWLVLYTIRISTNDLHAFSCCGSFLLVWFSHSLYSPLPLILELPQVIDIDIWTRPSNLDGLIITAQTKGHSFGQN